MRRFSRLLLLFLAVLALGAIASCATVIGLDKIQRVDCTEDCNETDATLPPEAGGPDVAPADTGPIDTGFTFPDIVLVDSVGFDSAAPDTTVPHCTAGGCDGGVCDLDAGVCRPLYTIGGTVSGLATGASVVLQDNGGNDVTVSANGAFVFTTPLPAGASYAVTVLTQPSSPMQACGVSGGTGIATANVSNVTVTCVTDAYAIGGTVTGLATGDTVVLQDNGGNDLTLGSNGPFMFTTPIPSGMAYAVTVLTQPGSPVQTCTVTGGTGTASANVTNVAVACTTVTFTVGGTLTGLTSGSMVVLQDNGGDNLTLTANGAFMFATPVASGAAYTVTVLTQPTSPPQTCVLSAAMGNVGTGNVTSIVVNCAIDTYTVGGTVSGLATGESVTLLNNGADSLTVTANGAFAFSTPLQPGSVYAVTLTGSPTAPVDETCTLTGASGTIANANVTSVALSCAPLTFTVGGTVTGLAPGGTVTLQDNGGDTTQIGQNGPFTFPTSVTSGQSFDATIAANGNPTSQFCAVTSGAAGTVTNANVMVVGVNCYTPPFPSTGSNGEFSPAASVVLPGGTYNYTSITIPAGVTVTASGNGVLDLRSSGPVLIGGTINVSGSPGGAPQPCNEYPGGGGGGATGIAGYVATFGLGDGGAGGPGGMGTAGAAGAEEPDAAASLGGLGGDFGGGGGGTVPKTGAGGGGGGGYAGGGGGSGGTLLGGAGGGGEGGGGGAAFWQGGGGGQFSGGGPYNGASGQNGQLGNGASDGSIGGSTETGAGGGGGGISSAAAADLAVATTFQSGSGGGGGSGNYSSPGGGGGGGGGALRLSGSSIVVQGTAKILAAGGVGAAGLSSCNQTGPGGGGGGGSGGVIFLDAPTISVAGGATVSAAGGGGAPSVGSLAGGGAGGLGRIRFSLVTAASSLAGTYTPPLQGGASAANTPTFTFIAEYPN